jgi:outer membrane lipoprotein-sorting protein
MEAPMNTRAHFIYLSLVLILAAIITASFAAPSAADSPTLQEVISKHLDSIGSPEARASMKGRVILGTAVTTFRIGGKGQANGRAVLGSQGNMSLVGISFDVPEYPRENLGFDGKILTVADLTPGVRSTLGKFFMTHEMPFREGLLAGTLSTAWPLLDTSSRKATLKYEGMKKIDGRQLHVVRYDAKNDSGLKTRLYFDAETFRHVRTEYEQRQIQQMVTQPGVTQQQGDSITKLIEEFSDFKTETGLTLPHTYKLQLSIETLNRRVLQDWVFTLSQFVFNKSLDPKQFDVNAK